MIVSKLEIDNYFKIQEENLQMYMRVAEKLEKEGNINDALNNYYFAYLISNLLYKSDFVFNDILIQNYLINKINTLIDKIKIISFDINLVSKEMIQIDIFILNCVDKYIEFFDGKEYLMVKGNNGRYTFNTHIDFIISLKIYFNILPLKIDFFNDNYLKLSNDFFYDKLSINKVEKSITIDKDYYERIIKPNSIYDYDNISQFFFSVNKKNWLSKNKNTIFYVNIFDNTDKIIISDLKVFSDEKVLLYLDYGNYKINIREYNKNKNFINNKHILINKPVIKKEFKK